MHLLQRLSKELGLGALAYWLYYAPSGVIQKYVKRNPMSQLRDELARREMESSVFCIPPLQWNVAQPTHSIYFLTGKRFWYQTCLCAYSMAQHSDANLQLIIYDDGSLETAHIAELERIFPKVQVISVDEIEESISTHLPESRFPFLRERRRNYPNIRKLIDFHVGSKGWKLVLDSDMLFFRKPTLLLEWLAHPDRPCYMTDVVTSYGYSDSLMVSLANAPLPQLLNVGICGLDSSTLNWEHLEYWCRILIERERTHYYLEQALVAMIVAGKSCTVASADQYIVMPNREEVRKPKAILHHYVADSKPWYFRYGWRQALKAVAAQ